MRRTAFITMMVLAATLVGKSGLAHCDSLSGPVVADARVALKSGRVEAVLKWIGPADEAIVRDAFAKVLVVREQGDAARELADRWFFETVVRLHRATEGETFSGLRAADWNPPRLVALADDAIRRRTGAEIERAVVGEVTAALRERLQRVLTAKEHADESVAAGREFVAAYTSFLQFVEKFDSAENVSSEQPEGPRKERDDS